MTAATGKPSTHIGTQSGSQAKIETDIGQGRACIFQKG